MWPVTAKFTLLKKLEKIIGKIQEVFFFIKVFLEAKYIRV